MVLQNTSKILLLAVIVGMMGFNMGKALGSPEQDFTNQATADYQTINDYVNGTFAKSMGFFTTLGWNTPADVFDLLSGPRLELGIGVGADLIRLPDLNNLSLQAINLGSNFSIPTEIPAPFPVITARVGLLNGLDAGVKFNYLPLVSLPNLGVAANYYGWGLDLRYKIVDSVYAPTVTVGVSWDQMKGNVNLLTSINQTSTYVDGGTTYNANLTGNNNYALNWETKSFGAQIQVGKDLGVIYPFAAVGFQRNSGYISSSMTGSGTLNLQPSLTSPTNLNLNVTSNSPPVYFEPKFVLGFDFGGRLHWAIVGESNGTDIAGSTSLRVQF